MRLFTAIDIPDGVRERLRGLTAELMPTAPLEWSPEANWHITTKFVGEFGDGPAMEAALATVRVPAFDVEIRGLGWYPNPHQPRVFFAGWRHRRSWATFISRPMPRVADWGCRGRRNGFRRI